jgi:hypothetical protein
LGVAESHGGSDLVLNIVFDVFDRSVNNSSALAKRTKKK